jgi:hypothetical protein
VILFYVRPKFGEEGDDKFFTQLNPQLNCNPDVVDSLEAQYKHQNKLEKLSDADDNLPKIFGSFAGATKV